MVRSLPLCCLTVCSLRPVAPSLGGYCSLNLNTWLFFEYEKAPWVGTRNPESAPVFILGCSRVVGNIGRLESKVSGAGVDSTATSKVFLPSGHKEKLHVAKAGWAPDEVGIVIDRLVYRRGIFAQKGNASGPQ